MKITMWRLKNSVKNYEWGSLDMIAKLFHINNPTCCDTKQPVAEVWMGAHLSGVSIAIDAKGNQTDLDKLIAKNLIQILGEQSYQQYHSLPYLFKILSAKDPLSIQVHPELSKAKLGYEKEDKLGIPLDSPKRNYKDPNHKPELVYAITPFLAMNAFRLIGEIVSLFSQLNIDALKSEVEQLANKQDNDQLKQFFHSILTLDNNKKQTAISQLTAKIAPLSGMPFDIMKEIIQKYPDDSGVFSPLILNVIELQPGQAMFLHAQTPHAYLKGTSLEIMASSDNVLRAGLTPKFIDIDELFANTTFNSIPANQLLTDPVFNQNKIDFPVPVNDFAFEIIESDMNKRIQQINSAEILLCLEGEVTISTSTNSYTIKTGESVFIARCAQYFTYQGKGKCARAFNQ